MGFIEDVMLEAQGAPDPSLQTPADFLLDSIINGNGRVVEDKDDSPPEQTEAQVANLHNVNGATPKNGKDHSNLDELNQIQIPKTAVPGPPATDPQLLLHSVDDSNKAAGPPISEDLADLDTIMSGTTRPSRSRAAKTSSTSQVMDAEYRPATLEEKQKWRGFCEIESEPAILNALIQDMGVADLALEEVYAIDEEVIEQLGPRIHGLLFLYQVSDDDNLENDAMEGEEKMQDAPIPESLWFANQTASNACATVALVNLLANTQSAHGLVTNPDRTEPHTDSMTLINRLLCDTMGSANESNLRKQLHANQDSPVDITAFQRGEAVRKLCGFVHNKYARKMDMLNADLVVDNEWSDAEKKSKSTKKRQPAKSTKRKAKSNKRKKPNLEDSIHHYVAYLHKDHAIWMLDGMQYRPVRLKSYTGDGRDWWRAVLPTIQQRMAKFEFGGIGANLLALVDRVAGNDSQYQADREHAEANQVDDGPLLHAWIEMVIASKAWKDSMIVKGSF